MIKSQREVGIYLMTFCRALQKGMMEGGGDKIMNKVWIHLYDRFILENVQSVDIFIENL